MSAKAILNNRLKERTDIMKPIIFARITDMDYYRGVTETDIPVNGGSHIDETGEGGECYNFSPVYMNGEEICLGYVMLIGTATQICLENIVGGDFNKNDTKAEGVTVVWCAKSGKTNTTQVVGFYKNATVYRTPQKVDVFDKFNNFCGEQYFNFKAKKEDCVLLPRKERDIRKKWYIPLSGNYGYDFGFGRSHIWLANGGKGGLERIEFVKKIAKNIEEYNGINWINKEVL